MMENGLNRLNDLARRAQRDKNSTVPDYAIPTPRFKDKTANELTRSIIKWPQLNGHQAERISVEGRVIDTRKIVVDGIGRRKMIGKITRIKSSAQRGSADVSATICGRSIKIEIKIGNDTQSKAQREYQQSVEAAEGIYIIVSNFQRFFDWYLIFTSELTEVAHFRRINPTSNVKSSFEEMNFSNCESEKLSTFKKHKKTQDLASSLEI